MLALIMVLSLAACGASSQESINNQEEEPTVSDLTQESEKRYIGETEFLTPDDVTVRSEKSETVQLTEDSQHIDYEIVFTYASASSVDQAYNDYKNYLNSEFPDNKDSKGFMIGLSLSYESSSFSVHIEQEQEKPVITDEMLKDFVGKYREIKNPGWSDNDIEQMWQERSWYRWLDIDEDGTVRKYKYDNGEVTQANYEDKLENILPYITGDTIDMGDLVYKKTSEIPDIEN